MRALDISIIGKEVGNIYSKSHAFYSCIHNILIEYIDPSVVYKSKCGLSVSFVVLSISVSQHHVFQSSFISSEIL